MAPPSDKTRPLRAAAGVVLWYAGEPARWLWVRRSDTAPFLPGFHSFPGGAVDADDARMATDLAPGTQDAALRVAALRELFEETGILRVVRAPTPDEQAALLAAFRASEDDGRARFRALGLTWRAAELEPLGQWTAPDFATARFDTTFYACRVDGPLALALHPAELSHGEWITADEAWARWSRAEVRVGPPVAAVIRASRGASALVPARVRAIPGGDGVPLLRYEFTPGLQTLPLRTPTLPPATHTNAFIVGTGDAVLVEPASPYEEDIARVVAWVEENARIGIHVRALVLTHHHPDHAGGARVLSERLGLPIWAHALTAERLGSSVPVARHLEDGETIELAGELPMELRALHTPGHAPGHLCFHELGSRALIAGDMVAGVGTILVEPTDGDMALYLASLARMAEEEPSALLPAHGWAMADPGAVLTRYREHRLAREARVLDALRQHTGAASPADLLPVAYADAPTSVWPIAAMATEAHLIHLAKQGLARRVGDRWAA